jgi:sensor histidine kinase YesM
LTRNQFVFSNKPIHRITRHLVFWIVFTLHLASQNFLVGGYKEAERLRSLPEILQYLAFFLPFFIVTAYFFMYVVLPQFLFTLRTKGFYLTLVMIFIINLFVANEEGILYIHYAMQLPYDKIDLNTNKYHVLVNGFWIPLTVMVITGGIRLTKKWIIQQKENEELEKQRISKELKLLKTQIHPRFLIHSLASLESNLYNKVSDSPNNILKLSDLLSYILYESDDDHVLLEKELEVLRQYMELQKINHAKYLGVHMNMDIDTQYNNIAPLILFPFLESSFEHFNLNTANQENMKVDITAKGEYLHFDLTSTGTDMFPNKENAAGPVWTDIKKRLQSQYPNNHSLYIKKSPHNFILQLQLNMANTLTTETVQSYSLKAVYEY